MFKNIIKSDNKTLAGYLDEITSERQNDESMVILMNLKSNITDTYSKKLNLEAFYSGVDVVTNFKNELFTSVEDFAKAITKLKSVSTNIIFVGNSQQLWTFESIPETEGTFSMQPEQT